MHTNKHMSSVAEVKLFPFQLNGILCVGTLRQPIQVNYALDEKWTECNLDAAPAALFRMGSQFGARTMHNNGSFHFYVIKPYLGDDDAADDDNHVDNSIACTAYRRRFARCSSYLFD